MEQSASFYNRFSNLYPLVDVFLRPQKKKLFREINLAPNGRLLEIGVGTGSHLKYYHRHEITGIDTSESMLARARKHRRSNLQLLQMNGESLSFPDEAFDYVVLSHVIAVVEDPEKVLDEVHRVLKPGGKVFILNHFTPDNWLKHLDGALAGIAVFFHVKSVFKLPELSKIKKFNLLSERNTGLFSYFKILIYEKNL